MGEIKSALLPIDNPPKTVGAENQSHNGGAVMENVVEIGGLAEYSISYFLHKLAQWQ